MNQYIDPNDIPIGWANLAACLNMDIDRLIEKCHINSFESVETKEKYGSLRVYYDAEADNDDGYRELSDLISIYEAISENTCIYCGKYPVYMIEAGWISPVCETCYTDKRYAMKPYDEVRKDPLPTDHFVTIRKYSSDHGAVDRKLDLRPYIKRIAAYAAKHPITVTYDE